MLFAKNFLVERERERKGGNEILNLSLLSKNVQNVQNVHMLKTEKGKLLVSWDVKQSVLFFKLKYCGKLSYFYILGPIEF